VLLEGDPYATLNDPLDQKVRRLRVDDDMIPLLRVIRRELQHCSYALTSDFLLGSAHEATTRSQLSDFLDLPQH